MMSQVAVTRRHKPCRIASLLLSWTNEHHTVRPPVYMSWYVTSHEPCACMSSNHDIQTKLGVLTCQAPGKNDSSLNVYPIYIYIGPGKGEETTRNRKHTNTCVSRREMLSTRFQCSTLDSGFRCTALWSSNCAVRATPTLLSNKPHACNHRSNKLVWWSHHMRQSSDSFAVSRKMVQGRKSRDRPVSDSHQEGASVRLL